MNKVTSCKKKTCGEPCNLSLEPRPNLKQEIGVCDGIGHCRHLMENPCAVHGCDEKKCGEVCLNGDIQGWCDNEGKCEPSFMKPVCGRIIIILFN